MPDGERGKERIGNERTGDEQTGNEQTGNERTGKVLIVDDEQVEREGLRAMLLRHLPGLDVELARNGREAIAKAAAFRPDLILMDIKMPGMSGLEAVDRIRRRHPDIQFVMVTAYDEFEFARQALKYGVKDYLLKPSRPAETAETVRRVLDGIAAERAERAARARASGVLARMRPVLEADLVTQLLLDHRHEIGADELAEWMGGRPERESFVMLFVLSGGGREADVRFHAALRERVHRHASGWVGALTGRHIPAIIFREPGMSYRAQAASLMQRILPLARDFPGLGLFAGIGTPQRSLAGLRQSRQEALIASADPPGPVRYRFYEDLPALRELKDRFPDKAAETAFLEHVRTGRWDRVEEMALAYCDRWETGGFPLVHAAQRMLELLWLVSRVLAETGIETPPPSFSFRMADYRALRAEVRSELDRLLQAARKIAGRMENSLVERVKRTVLQRSHEDLSLERIAAEEGVSPYHLSRLFKAETGVNYIDFLTARRMEKARALLGNPRLSLKQIAFEVGYRDPNYFSRVFRKATGLSPREYRRLRLGGEGGSGRNGEAAGDGGD
jgi:two-component system response regulator YesN